MRVRCACDACVARAIIYCSARAMCASYARATLARSCAREAGIVDVNKRKRFFRTEKIKAICVEKRAEY